MVSPPPSASCPRFTPRDPFRRMWGRRLFYTLHRKTRITTYFHSTYATLSSHQSGKEEMSPSPPPLRTVRATFTAHGSSKPIYGSARRVSPSSSIQPLVYPLNTLLAKRHSASISSSQFSVYHLWGWFTCLTSAYQAGYVFPVRFRCLPWLLETSCAREELVRSYDWITDCSDLNGVTLFRIS